MYTVFSANTTLQIGIYYTAHHPLAEKPVLIKNSYIGFALSTNRNMEDADITMCQERGDDSLGVEAGVGGSPGGIKVAISIPTNTVLFFKVDRIRTGWAREALSKIRSQSIAMGTNTCAHTVVR